MLHFCEKGYAQELLQTLVKEENALVKGQYIHLAQLVGHNNYPQTTEKKMEKA